MIDIFKLVKKIVLVFGQFYYYNNSSKIIYYHDIFDKVNYTCMGTSLSEFKKHCEVIKNEGFNIVGNITRPENEIQIVLDDGFQGIWDTRDFFIKNNILPKIFISVKSIGKEGYLTEIQILELQKYGFDFQSHAFSHQDLTKLTGDRLFNELLNAKTMLENILGKKVCELCFPFGYFNDEIICKSENIGFNKFYSSVPGGFYDNIFHNVIARNLVQHSSKSELKAILHGGYGFLKNRYIKQHYRN